MKRHASFLLSMAALAACQSTEPATKTVADRVPAPTIEKIERDLAAYGASIQQGGIFDLERFQPQENFGERCTARPLPRASDALPEKLQTALVEADAYSIAEQGKALVVLHDGKIIHSNFAEGISPDTPSDSFSMHKSVLALAIGAAIDDGLIGSVDDRIGDYIAEWKNDPRGDIPLRSVLEMSSGLKLFSLSQPTEQSRQLYLSADINGAALDHPMVDQPGDEFRYNNVNSQIAGIVLQRALLAAGQGRYADFLGERVWCPLGNGKAGLWLDREEGNPRFYASMYADAHDWARIGEMIRNRGSVEGKQIISTSWIAEITKPSAANPNYGLQVWLGNPWTERRRYSAQSPVTIPHSAPYLADDVIFFDGFGGQRVYVVQSAQLTVVRTGEVNLAYDDAKIVNLILAGLD